MPIAGLAATRQAAPAAAKKEATKTTTTKGAGDLAPIIVEIVPGAGGFVSQVGGRQLPSREELTDVLRKIENKLDGAFVRAADEAPFVMVAAAIQACNDAGFLKTVFAPAHEAR